MIKRMIAGAVLLAAALAFAVPSAAQDAAEIYSSFADSLTQHDRMSVDINVDFAVTVDGTTESMSAEVDVALDRSGQFAYKLATPDITVQFYGDGEELVTYIPSFDQYTTGTQTGTAREVLASAGFGPIQDTMMIVSEIAAEDPFSNMLAVAETVEYVSQETLRGNDYHRVRVGLDGMSWDAWFSAGDSPTLYRIDPTFDSLIEHFKTMGDNVDVDIVVDFENWSFGESVAGEQLAFLPEGSAREVQEFARPTPAQALVGKRAPDIELSRLGGGTFNLHAKGQDEVIVLDFWATWCGPCRVAMPIIEQVTSEFADRGVRLYAVNLQEEPEEINAFLEEEGIDVTVVLDTDATAARAYRAEAIPQTVIVGQDGVVQTVHVGVLPDLEEKLRSELQTLVDGGSLL